MQNKEVFEILSDYLAEMNRMDMIDRDAKMEVGYWMISPDRNGGYAYAKICSNGYSFYLNLPKK